MLREFESNFTQFFYTHYVWDHTLKQTDSVKYVELTYKSAVSFMDIKGSGEARKSGGQ